VTEATAPLLEKIASLEAENVRLRAGALARQPGLGEAEGVAQ
jgi:hypothetical protein